MTSPLHCSLARFVAGLGCLLLTVTFAVAQTIPGQPPPPTQPTKGSVLIFNYYASRLPLADNAQLVVNDTVMNITNTSPTASTALHLFFFDGNSGSSADAIVCLAPGQTVPFNASDWDPDNRGYFMALALDSNGVPTNFNNLTGQAILTLNTGATVGYPAQAIEALVSNPAVISGSFSATLNFNGVNYSKLPRAVGLNPVLRPAGLNQTVAIINHLGGNLFTSPVPLGTLNWLFTNNSTRSNTSYTTSGGNQFRGTIADTLFPGLSTKLKGSQTATMRTWTTNDLAISGIFVRFREVKKAAILDGFGNLDVITVTDSSSLVVPVFTPSC